MSKRLTSIGAVNSGGSLNHFTSHIVQHAIDLGLQQAHLERLRTTYRGRVKAMEAALTEHLSDQATWTRPDGGYFFWLKLKNNTCARKLQERAKEMEVGFHAGELFSSSGRMENCVRLSFAHYNGEDIRKGIARLKLLFD